VDSTLIIAVVVPIAVVTLAVFLYLYFRRWSRAADKGKVTDRARKPPTLSAGALAAARNDVASAQEEQDSTGDTGGLRYHLRPGSVPGSAAGSAPGSAPRTPVRFHTTGQDAEW